MTASDAELSALSAQPACIRCAHALHGADVIRYLCRVCESRTQAHLADLPDLYVQLHEMLEPGAPRAGSASRGTRHGAASPAPCNLEVLNLVAPGGRYSVLWSWTADWRDLLDPDTQQPRNTGRNRCNTPISRAVTFLRDKLSWAVEKHPAVDDFAAEVQRLWQEATAITNPRIRLGYCPATHDDGTACGAVLRATPGATAVSCDWCNTTWSERHLIRLAQVLQPAA
ncbi:hypothetical protein [Streptomyces sp. N35]|uniref:hypothetical protein n=1 Tax=Streptomyces sp. N35 TaxID=2795730 RepID=UPI0018F32781|nr:hypothetical protein [Streptomyces sp. N35]